MNQWIQQVCTVFQIDAWCAASHAYHDKKGDQKPGQLTPKLWLYTFRCILVLLSIGPVVILCHLFENKKGSCKNIFCPLWVVDSFPRGWFTTSCKHLLMVGHFSHRLQSITFPLQHSQKNYLPTQQTFFVAVLLLNTVIERQERLCYCCIALAFYPCLGQLISIQLLRGQQT